MNLLPKHKTRKTPTSDRNFGLSEEEFNTMAQDLKNGNEQIFEKIFLSHFSDCMNYLKMNYKANHTEAYDISMDTLIHFREGLIKDKYRYGNLRFLFTRMAAQRFIKEKKKEMTTIVVDELLDMQAEIEINNIEDERFLKIAWNKLDAKSQKLLKQFYVDKMKLKDIAFNENKTDSAIRKQKERSLIALRKNFSLVRTSMP